MRRNWMKWLFIGGPTLLLTLFALTFIPHKLFNINPSDVAKIVVFNGNNGKETVIRDKEAIHTIVLNLNSVTFQKGKPSIGYMGYHYRITIFDKMDSEQKKFIMNSSDTIRYNGFFYRTENESLIYDYLNEIVK